MNTVWFRFFLIQLIENWSINSHPNPVLWTGPGASMRLLL